jgi:hypothetical protein
MFELTINDAVYQFRFGMGFMKEINATVSTPIDGLKNVEKSIGLNYHVAALIDGDLESLEKILIAANKGMNPRVTAPLLDSYIDDENTDVDALIKEVLDFLRKSNATRSAVATLEAAVEKQKAEN